MLGRRIVRVRQNDTADCGAACLHSVAAYYRLRVPRGRIRESAGTTAEGTSILGLVDAASRLGMEAKGVRGTYEALSAIPMPAIAHLDLGGVLHHFVVLYGYRRKHVVVMDPADGRVHRIDHGSFRAQWTGVLVLLVPGERFRPGRQSPTVGQRFWMLIRPHRTLVAQALVGAALYTVLGLSTAVYVQKVVDDALPSGSRELLNLLGAVMVAVVAAQAILGWTRDRISLETGQRIDAALILAYYRHLLDLPQRFFDTRRIGEITARIGDAIKIRAFINEVALDLSISVLVIVLALGLMLGYSPALAGLVLAGIPAYAAIYALANHANRRTQRRVMETAAELEAELVESVGAVATLRASSAAEWASHRLELRLVRFLRPVYRAGMNGIAAGTATEVVSRGLTVALLWMGGGMVVSGDLTTGELMSFFALTGYLTGPIATVIMANRSLQDAVIAADRLFEVLDIEREQEDRRPDLAPALIGDLRLDDVHFAYGPGVPVLSGLSLTVRRGSMTALVGESGCGKSTIVGLLSRQYTPLRGRITIGGMDLRDFSLGSVRARIGTVPQRVDLISGTVIENIAVGDFEPDMARLAEICDALGLTEFVLRLPAGFHTRVGEQGIRLSGGQRQRIGLARALYPDPDVLVLDEATSSLDPAAEDRVRSCLRRLRTEGKTLIVIAHRLSSVIDADSVAVIAGGRTVEEGTHAVLSRREGPYAALWRTQQREGSGPIPGPAPSAAGVGRAGADWLGSIVG